MIGARVVAYVNRAAVPSVVLPEDLRDWAGRVRAVVQVLGGFVPPVPALLHSEYTAPH